MMLLFDGCHGQENGKTVLFLNHHVHELERWGIEIKEIPFVVGSVGLGTWSV